MSCELLTEVVATAVEVVAEGVFQDVEVVVMVEEAEERRR